jgi:peroxiredoxin Q/BCP
MTCSTVARALPLVAGIAASTLQAQQAPKEPEPLQVGAVAPDFTLPGATRYGTLKAPIHLSDFKGKTVVLAFFFKARTKG